MNNRLSLLLIGCIFPFLSFYAQKNMNLPPYYPTVKGITDYAVWQLVYPDSLLKADIAGLEKDVVLAGMLNRIEIWSKTKWMENNSCDNMDDIAEQMSDLGLCI